MNPTDEPNDNSQTFLMKTYELTHGTTANKVSMYDVGNALGIDKAAASETAQYLMGLGWIEIRTLSGGIGITEEGLTVAEAKGAGGGRSEDKTPSLGHETVLDSLRIEMVNKVLEVLKQEVGTLGLPYDDLNEVIADFKTMEIQLTSPRPKTAIVRAGFVSIGALLERKTPESAGLKRLWRLLNDN